MTYRQILLSLAVGQTHVFDTPAEARSASAAAAKLYLGLRFTRSGNAITRMPSTARAFCRPSENLMESHHAV